MPTPFHHSADGFFRTGDIGEQTPDGRLRVIDRKKNLFKLAQGEFVAPSYVENVLLQAEFVDQIYVYGDALHSHVVRNTMLNSLVFSALRLIKKKKKR